MTIKTDHKPLIFIFKQKSDRASPKQARQIDFISQYTTDIVHISGTENPVADALSRIEAVNVPVLFNTEEIATEQQQDEDTSHPEGKNITTPSTFQSHRVERHYIAKHLRTPSDRTYQKR